MPLSASKLFELQEKYMKQRDGCKIGRGKNFSDTPVDR